MKLVHPRIETVLDFDQDSTNTLVIENSKFFREVIEDIYTQISGAEGVFVLSQNGKILDFSKNVEMISRYVPFDINQKNLLTKVCSELEKESLNENNYMKSQELLQRIENYLNELSFVLPCDIRYSKLNLGNIIKSVGVLFEEESNNLAESLLDYMNLICQLERDKLFIFTNLRSYLTDDETKIFLESAKEHAFKLLLIDNCEKERFVFEKRVVIDNDLCEI